jgi:hypothetical protein
MKNEKTKKYAANRKAKFSFNHYVSCYFNGFNVQVEHSEDKTLRRLTIARFGGDTIKTSARIMTAEAYKKLVEKFCDEQDTILCTRKFLNYLDRSFHSDLNEEEQFYNNN